MLEIRLDNLETDLIRIVDDNGETVQFSLREELRINEMNVQQEFLEQSSKYVYWTSILERVRLYQESSKLHAEIARADLYEPCRSALINTGIPKPTKDQVDAKILQDEDYIRKLEALNTYDHLVKQLQFVVRAFEQRKDMLIQFGADKRKEQDYEKKISSPYANNNV